MIVVHDRPPVTGGVKLVAVSLAGVVIEPDLGSVKAQIGLSIPAARPVPTTVTLRHVGGDAVLSTGPGPLVDARDVDQRAVTIPAGRTGVTADVVVYGNRLAEVDNSIEILGQWRRRGPCWSPGRLHRPSS